MRESSVSSLIFFLLPLPGDNCEILLAPCSPRPCKNGGVCKESEDYQSFSCICPEGWQGIHLSIPAPAPKFQFANLQHDNFQPLIFPSIFSSEGQTCEIDINECVKAPCRNGAVCQNTMGGYQCVCQPGYTGQRCETDTDDCKPSKEHTDFSICCDLILTASKIKILLHLLLFPFFRSVQQRRSVP